jgi:hypothetical protein
MSGRSAHAGGVVHVWTRRTMRTVQRDACRSDERRRETLTRCGSSDLWAIGALHTADAPPPAGPGKARDTVAPEAVFPPLTGRARRTFQPLSRDAEALRHVAAGRLCVGGAGQTRVQRSRCRVATRPERRAGARSSAWRPLATHAMMFRRAQRHAWPMRVAGRSPWLARVSSVRVDTPRSAAAPATSRRF